VLIDIDDPGSPVMDPILNSLPDFFPAGNNSRQMDSMWGVAFWFSSLKSWFMLLFLLGSLLCKLLGVDGAKGMQMLTG
jgi:hypothetical protein